jgi:small conductance mechanosensitive channel
MENKELQYVHSFEQYVNEFINTFIAYSPKLISALLILFIGLYAIRFINRLVKKIMLRNEFDPTLSKFLASSLLWALRLLLFITVISRLGIESSSFVAILGAAGLAVGLSLQGSLSNFAGGVLIIMFKPFRVGDSIDAQGVSGTVQEIQIFTTKLITSSNQTIFIPNGILSNGIIVNYSLLGYRRANLTLSISYDTNIKIAKDIVTKVIESHPDVLKTPKPSVSVQNLTDSAVILSIQPWSKNEHFSNMSSDILEQCKEAFDTAGITIQPYAIEASK